MVQYDSNEIGELMTVLGEPHHRMGRLLIPIQQRSTVPLRAKQLRWGRDRGTRCDDVVMLEPALLGRIFTDLTPPFSHVVPPHSEHRRPALEIHSAHSAGI